MIDLLSKDYRPSLEEIGAYIHNPVFLQFCTDLTEAHSCKEQIEYSACSMGVAGMSSLKNPGRRCAPSIPGSSISP